MHLTVHCSTAYSDQGMEIASMCIGRRMGKEDEV